MSKVPGEHIKRALQKFGQKTIQKAAANLINGKRGYDTGALMKSLDYDLAVSLNSFMLKFDYLDYGEEIDKGRKRSTRSNGGVLFNKILDWVKRKNLRPRSSTGQFQAWKNKTQQQRSIAFLVTRKIHRFGYEGTGFFTKAFDYHYKRTLPSSIKKAYMLDFDSFMKYTLDEINNGNNRN